MRSGKGSIVDSQKPRTAHRDEVQEGRLAPREGKLYGKLNGPNEWVELVLCGRLNPRFFWLSLPNFHFSFPSGI